MTEVVQHSAVHDADGIGDGMAPAEDDELDVSLTDGEAAAVAGRFVWLAVVIGAVVGGLVLATMDTVLGGMNVSAELRGPTRRLAQLRCVGAPLELASTALRGLLSGCGDTSAQLRVTIAECLLQTALAAVLIGRLGWGVEAVGVGLLISQAVGVSILLRRLRSCVGTVEAAALPHPALLWRCLVDCSPLVCRTFSLHAVLTLQSRTAAGLGDAAMAAHGVARQASSVGSLLVDSLAVAAQVSTAEQRFNSTPPKCGFVLLL